MRFCGCVTRVPRRRVVATAAPLDGGGELSADLSLSIASFGASGGTHAPGVVPDPGAVAGSTRFLREDATWAEPAGGPGSTDWGDIGGVIGDQADLAAALAGKEATGTAAVAVAAHEAASDPHPGYQRESEKAAANGYASLDGSTKVPVAQLPVGSAASTVCAGDDARLSDARAPSGSATGDLGGSYPSPTVTLARGLRETAGPTILAVGAVADGEYLRRSGSSIVGGTPAGGGGSAALVVPLVSDGAGITWTNMPAAVTFFAGSHRFATKIDLTAFTQVRLIVNKQGTAGQAGSLVRLRYITVFSTTVGSWLQIGASSVEVGVAVQNTVLASAWINLAAGAKADVFITLDGSGGNGTLDPAFGSIVAQFK